MYDYTEAEAMLAEPAWIKVQLPIAYVAEKAGVMLVAGEGRLHGLCPFHQDSNPSFDIYPWGGGERFGCFSCGAGGDVLDFIMLRWGHGFREACEMAKRGIIALKAEGWDRPVLAGRFDWNEEAAKDLLQRAEPAPDRLMQIIEAKRWKFPSTFLFARWGVRAQGKEMLVPVWDEGGALVAIKHRPLSGARSLISLPGSRLRSTLYGAHLLRPDHRVVILTEGESDAWTADWITRSLGDVAVLSLPAGAGAAPCRLDLLTDRIVYVAFDGDDAGRMSAARWFAALDSRCIRGDILDLPDGQDITSITAAEPTWLASKLGGL